MSLFGSIDALSLALLLCRFTFAAAGMLLWGASIFLWTSLPPALRWYSWQRLSNWRHAALLCLVLAGIAYLPLQTAIIGDGWRDAIHPELLYRVASATSIGTTWFCQTIGIVMLLLLTRVRSSRSLPATAIVSAGLLASLALTGHAVMGEGGWRSLHQFNDVLHLLSAGAWSGALLVVLQLLPAMRQPAWSALARTALQRFSTAGHVAVLLVLLTGTVNTWLILGSWPLDWSFPYQRLLALKIAVVLMMVVIAVTNRYVLVPRMRNSPVAVRLFWWGTVGEIALAVLAIALLAWLGTLQPN